MFFNALRNLSFFFKNLGLLEFTPIPCSSLSPNLSHLHCKIVYSSAKLLWKVKPETISASTCFPKLAPFKKQASPPFRNKTLEAANQKFCSFHFTAFCFQLLLSLISHFLLLFSLLPLSFDPSLLWLAELFHEVSIREPVFLYSRNKQHKVGILLSCHLPVLIKKTFKNVKMKGKWVMFPTRSQI